MKNTIALLLIFTLTLPLFGCSNKQKSMMYDTEQVEHSSVSNTEATSTRGKWEATFTTDEFGDVQWDSKIVLRCPISGNFSNSATLDSELSGYVFLTPDQSGQYYHIFIRLFEYGSSPATFSSREEKTLKVKIVDTIKESKLLSSESNGDLLVEDLVLSNTIFHNLYIGNDVRCIVYIGNSQYNFTLESDNFLSACEEANLKLAEQADNNAVNSVHDMLGAFLNRERHWERTKYSTEHVNDFPLLSNDELETVIAGTWLRITVDDLVHDDWWIFSYSEDGTISQIGRYLDEKFEPTEPYPTPYKVENGFLYIQGLTGSYENADAFEFRKLQDGYYLAVQTEGRGTYSKQAGDYVKKMYLYAQFDTSGKPSYDIK